MNGMQEILYRRERPGKGDERMGMQGGCIDPKEVKNEDKLKIFLKMLIFKKNNCKLFCYMYSISAALVEDQPLPPFFARSHSRNDEVKLNNHSSKTRG